MDEGQKCESPAPSTNSSNDGEAAAAATASDTSSESSIARCSKRMNTFKGYENIKRSCKGSYNLDLESYLNISSIGRSILSQYKKNNTLSRKTRNLLVDMIIKDMVTEYERYEVYIYRLVKYTIYNVVFLYHSKDL